jgi:hypothetical protein
MIWAMKYARENGGPWDLKLFFELTIAAAAKVVGFK